MAVSLHTITQFPIDLTDPIYYHYPAFKLGVQSAVRHYAQLMAPLAEQVISTVPNNTGWILTVPAYNVLPPAASLLCKQVYTLLREWLPVSIALSLVKIPTDPQAYHRNFQIKEAADRAKANDYSTMSWGDRQRSQVLSGSYICETTAFCDRAVLYINDINVTGTQQRFYEEYFAKVQAKTVRWLYLIEVEPSIGQAQPHLESSINYSNYASVEAFAQVLDQEEIEYTTKCIAKLFHYNLQEMEEILATLSPDRRLKIWQLVVAEGWLNRDKFKEKLDLLKAYGQTD